MLCMYVCVSMYIYIYIYIYIMCIYIYNVYIYTYIHTFNVLLSNMSRSLETVKTAFYVKQQTIDLILTLSFGQGETNAHHCARNSCARRNAAIILRSPPPKKKH